MLPRQGPCTVWGSADIHSQHTGQVSKVPSSLSTHFVQVLESAMLQDCVPGITDLA